MFRSASLEPFVLDDLDRLGIRLAVHRQLDHVGTRLHGRAAAAKPTASTATATAGASGVGRASLATESAAAATASAAAGCGGAGNHGSDEAPLTAIDACCLLAV